ncbi:glycosyltransferase family 4 protein [Hydrotalea sandarakina]|jgi:glycosyltransferase involved in cell wall biosynthesis|uniref:Glycosyltransferase involved in cell wall biosynthesis n=1 Tax=Hydrotalea sandarakina TaxID=1004304 RepID=A0A2W7TMF6_9BACT|nr:glycosyltransferase family 4 protein [Hydrotalea sandarakina]PZX64382.1 glycosyltransferase involved in cell wall biosynthesis [Hydrotalea sandarakina]
MKILINDHAGHSFSLSLSKCLADMGHQVMHCYCTSFESPKADFSNISSNITIIAISNKHKFSKYSIFKRILQEFEYVNKLSKFILDFQPDILLSGNTPLFIQYGLVKISKKNKIPFIYWCQDIYSIAIKKILYSKLWYLGNIIAYFFEVLESKILKSSAHIISISDDFILYINKRGVSSNKISIIENWANLNEIRLEPKNNIWAKKHNLDSFFCIVYSGTLGLKHDPNILLQIALHLKSQKKIKIVVVSEGIGASYLMEQKLNNKLDNLIILPYQNFHDFSYVLGVSDILVAVLENEAGLFSVPSKVLSYLCSQKPIILSAPLENLSSKIVINSGAGFCVPPGDKDALFNKIDILLKNAKLRADMGLKGRIYAEEKFQINSIATKFLQIFHMVTS